MAIRDKMRNNAAHLLERGETIQQVFPAQTMSQYWAIVSHWVMVFKVGFRVVVVTDRRIMVCQAGRFAPTKVNGVVNELPRHIMIGPARGLWYRFEILGERLYVHKRFHKDIAQADAARLSRAFTGS
jgi:hypothetical protein